MGVFLSVEVEGRPRARLCLVSVSPGMAAPLVVSECAHTHAKHIRGFLLFWCVIWHNGEIGDVIPARNGPVAPLGWCPPISGHRCTVLVATLPRTMRLCLR